MFPNKPGHEEHLHKYLIDFTEKDQETTFRDKLEDDGIWQAKTRVERGYTEPEDVWIGDVVRPKQKPIEEMKEKPWYELLREYAMKQKKRL